MSRKNFKVATAKDGKTPIQNSKHTFVVKDKTPTGKIKTLKDKEQIKKEREEQYKNFRVNALKRRAKRMGLSDEQIEAKVKELLNQLDTPNSYSVLVLFSSKDKDLVKQALLKEELVWKIMSDSHLFIDADQETLATIRKIMPPSAKIHPYCKKKAAILPTVAKQEKKPKKGGKPHSCLNGKKEMRKRHNIARLSKAKRKEFKKSVKTLRDRWKADKKKAGTVVQLNTKKGSTAPKKASTNLKKAA